MVQELKNLTEYPTTYLIGDIDNDDITIWACLYDVNQIEISRASQINSSPIFKGEGQLVQDKIIIWTDNNVEELIAELESRGKIIVA